MSDHPVIFRQDDVVTSGELLALAESGGELFGGAYFEPGADTLHINVVGRTSGTALRQLRAAIGVETGARGAVSVVVHEVPHSTAELRAVMADFTTGERWQHRTAGIRSSWGPDPHRNRVVIRLVTVEPVIERELAEAFGDKVVVEQEGDRFHHPVLVTPLRPATRVERLQAPEDREQPPGG